MRFRRFSRTIRLLSLLTMLLGTIAFAVSSPPNAYASVPATSKGSSVTVTAMTYNILSGVGLDNKYDLNRIATVIRDSHADIVGLQEVGVNWSDQHNFDNQVQILSKQLHMHAYFAPIYVRKGDENGGRGGIDNNGNGNGGPRSDVAKREQTSAHGIALLSVYPIVSAHNHILTRLSTIRPNPVPERLTGFADVTLDVGGVPVTVYVTHLDYRTDPKIRSAQVQEMLDLMGRHDGHEILLGDLNATPSAPELLPLLARLKDASASCTQCGTYPSNAPTRRIDYILVSPKIQVVSKRVIESTASDHRPVVAVLRIPGL